MDLLIELILELVVGATLEGANDSELPKGLRIGLLIFATLIYIAFVALFVGLFLTLENVFGKIISAGVVIFFIGGFIHMWRKALKAKEKKDERV